MLRQENAEVRVILICHEPPLDLPSDDRLIVEFLDSSRPKTRNGMMADKYLKIKAGLIRARAFAPMWLMRADADDLVSRRLAAFVERQPAENAWYSKTGWAHRQGSSWVMKLHDFHLICGTSCVTYVTTDDLPRTLVETPSNYYLLTKGHNIMVDYLRQSGVPTNPVPFPTTMYTVDSGENWSGHWSSTMRSKRWLMRRLMKSRYLTQAKRHEFGFDF